MSVTLFSTEEQFQQAVTDLAHMLGWAVYHTRDSRRSEPGFPDLMCLRDHGDTGEGFVAELKSASSRARVSDDQRWWLMTFAKAGFETYLWTPDDWNDIHRRLYERRPAPGPHPSSSGLAVALERVGAGGRGDATKAQRAGDAGTRAGARRRG